jgi:hypothetical protein
MDVLVVVQTIHRYVLPEKDAAKVEVHAAATTAAAIQATTVAMTLWEAVCFILCLVNELC